MSAFRPLLRVFIEGSVLRRKNIAGDLAALEIMSGVPGGGADPATDPSQYYSFELTILSTVISASVTDVTDPEVMKEGAFAFSIAGIFLAHSTWRLAHSAAAVNLCSFHRRQRSLRAQRCGGLLTYSSTT